MLCVSGIHTCKFKSGIENFVKHILKIILYFGINGSWTMSWKD